MLAAARKEELKNHPSPDDLAAYHARALPPSRIDQIQQHLTYCRDCSRVVMQLAPEIGTVRQHSPISGQHLSEAWERFVQQVVSESSAHCPPAEPGLPRRGRSTLAAMAALLIAAVGVATFSIWILRSIPQPEANIPLYILHPEGESIRSEATQPVYFPHEAENLILELQDSAGDPFLRYGLTIEAEEEGSRKVLAEMDNLLRGESGKFLIRLPRSYLPVGRYRLRLSGLEGNQKTPLATFLLQIKDPPAR